MITIDARKRLNADLMHEFLKDVQLDEQITVTVQYVSNTDTVIKQLHVASKDLRQFFEIQEFDYISDDAMVNLTVCDRQLLMIGLDYKWWHTARRLNKLFAEPTEKKPKQVKQSNDITVGIRYADKTLEVFHTGPMKDCVKWLNDTYTKYYIKAFGKKSIELSLRPNEWKNMSDYVEEGDITLQ